MAQLSTIQLNIKLPKLSAIQLNLESNQLSAFNPAKLAARYWSNKTAIFNSNITLLHCLYAFNIYYCYWSNYTS